MNLTVKAMDMDMTAQNGSCNLRLEDLRNASSCSFQGLCFLVLISLLTAAKFESS
jgi:hypothetical protein